MRKFGNLIILSNLAFLVPLLIAILKTYYLYAVLVFFVTIVSCLFHLNRERKYQLLDGMFAWTLIGVNIFSFSVKGLGNIYFWIALVFVTVGLYFKSKNHSLWHISSAIITLLALL